MMVEDESDVTVIDWNKIYVVSDQRRLATEDETKAVERACGTLPLGYRDFVTTFGFGLFDSIRILSPEDMKTVTDNLRDNLNDWIWFRKDDGLPFFVPESSPEDGVPLAGTDWGDYYFCSASDPAVLWHLWRPHDWDSCPSMLPLGFRNPFWHRFHDEPAAELGREDLIFHPHRSTFSCRAIVDCADIHGDHSQAISQIHSQIVTHISPDKVVSDDYGIYLFVKRWGAYFRIGYQPFDSQYYLLASMDEAHHCAYADLQSALERDGYRFAETD